jgi:6,7-dimethyl-8-ribityllumazine synthase
VCQAATVGLTQVSVDTRIPVGFGMLTCDTEAQALDRAGLPGSSEGKGYEAAQAAIATVLALHAKGNASELRQCPTKPFRRTSPGFTVVHQELVDHGVVVPFRGAQGTTTP